MATEYGLQLFSLRDITGNDLEGALKAVAEMGYKYVEYAGFFGHSAEQVKEWQIKLCKVIAYDGQKLSEIKISLFLFFIYKSGSKNSFSNKIENLPLLFC